MPFNAIPKVILHEHIEGSVTPALAQKLAHKHGVSLPQNFIYAEGQYDRTDFPNGRYAYDEADFAAFINTYDVVADLLRTPDDYYLAVYDFLSRNAKQGLIYCELISSPLHMSERDGRMDVERYRQVMAAIERAAGDIKSQFGLETRLHAVGIRHLGAGHVEEVIDFIDRHPQAIVTGFNIAGDERAGVFADFAPLLPRLERLQLGRSYHAGEICDADSVQQAINCGAMRIGHGVRAIDDAATVQRLIEQNITLEISITSNCLLVEPYRRNPAAHPVRKLYDAGVRISLNTDDAGIFGTDIAKEYRLAAQTFGFGRAELLDVSLCAVEAAFVGEDIKQSLIDRVYRAFEPEDIVELARCAERAASPALKQRLHQRLTQLAASPNASINTR